MSNDGWIVISCKWEDGDKNYKCVVEKGQQTRHVRFPYKVQIGQSVRLARI